MYGARWGDGISTWDEAVWAGDEAGGERCEFVGLHEDLGRRLLPHDPPTPSFAARRECEYVRGAPPPVAPARVAQGDVHPLKRLNPFPVHPLRRQVKEEAENRPGVYRFLGPRGEVLYVGKSVRVRTRLLSYFRHGVEGGKEVELMRVARAVRWEYLPTEFEALVRELRLIRALRPRFNVRHRRDRRYAWIRITREPAPRLVATRRPRSDGSLHFGPFPAPRRLTRLLSELAAEVGLRDCPAATPMFFSDQLDLLAPGRTPGCLRAELGSCPGPCAGLCDNRTYQEGVDEAQAFLEGRSHHILDDLAARMGEAAARRDFEGAARLRDRRDRLERLRSDVLEFGRFLRSLHFVYHPSTPDEAPLGEAPSTCVILRGQLRLTLPGPTPSLDPDEPAGRAVRHLLLEPPSPPHQRGAQDWEELFLLARWFRRRPEELTRTRPVESLLRTRPSPG
ncbi:MAG: nuclease [Gemmatimonadales bacterium]|nr:MAG: nuclease [Gemmatimonadales bacterium]